MKWFSGIGWDTPMRDIGWVWLLLLLAVGILIHNVWKLWREW